MKRFKIIIPLLIICLGLNAQKPENIYSIVKVGKPHSFYVEQAELWWKEIQQDKSNEKGWFNYYKACRYAQMTFGYTKKNNCEMPDNWLEESEYLRTQDEIWNLIEEAIPNTFTYYLFYKDNHYGDSDRLAILQKAYELEPDNPLIYDELVVGYETTGNISKRKEINKKWFQSNDLSPGMLNYNYNVLVGIEEGGVLLTFGDNDTFPAWMLQDALDFRKDVTILNIPLLTNGKYRSRMFSEVGIPELLETIEGKTSYEAQEIVIKHIMKNKPEGMELYVGTPVWKRFQFFEENLYLTGLILKYSEENIDNIALLKNNIEYKYSLDYLKQSFSFDISQSMVERINKNYLPGFVKIYNHYKLSGEAGKAQKIKELSFLIAERVGGEWEKQVQETFN